MFNLLKLWVASICLFICNIAFADISIPMFFTSPRGMAQPIGVIIATQKPYGVLLAPNLNNLSPGLQGFHIH